MNVPFEVYLCVGIAAFYVYDSAVLLYGNDFMVVASKKGPYIRYACDGPIVMRRFMYLPNPLTPLRGEYIATYRADSKLAANDHLWPTFHALTHLSGIIRPWIAVLGFELFIVAPYLSFAYGSGPELLSLFVAVYLTVVITFLSIYKHKDLIKFLGVSYWMMFFEGLLCPPFALNMERKLGMLSSRFSHEDVISAFFNQDRVRKILGDIEVKMSRDLKSLEADE